MVKNEIELKEDKRVQSNKELIEGTNTYESTLVDEPEYCLDNVIETLNEISKAPHYNTGVFEEVIEMAKKLFTPEEVMGFMKINSFKYRLRAGYKDDIEKDIKKALQYEKMYLEYLTELNNAKH